MGRRRFLKTASFVQMKYIEPFCFYKTSLADGYTENEIKNQRKKSGDEIGETTNRIRMKPDIIEGQSEFSDRMTLSHPIAKAIALVSCFSEKGFGS